MDAGTIAGIVGSVAGVISVAIAVLAWRLPRAPGGSTGPRLDGTELLRSPRLGLEFRQGNEPAPMRLARGPGGDPLVHVRLSPGPFELRFPALPPDRALQVCVWIDDSVFVLRPGMAKSDVPFFTPGTGSADYEFGSGTLYVSDHAHNYLTGNRVVRGDDGRDSFLVSRLSGPSAPGTSSLRMVALLDADGDGIIDHGEYEYVALDLTGR